MKDEEIEKVFVDGISHVHNNTIYLSNYQSEWVNLFNIEKQRITNVLKDKALMIEHIGSTSVEGLCAKPIIDILLVVDNVENEDDYLPLLLNEGYTLRIREDEDDEHHRMLKGIDIDINLHIYSKGVHQIDDYLDFRDYLRNNNKARDLYANTKKELSRRVWKYVQNYADAKSEVVAKILKEARK